MNEEREQLHKTRDMLISAIAQTMVIYGVTPSVGRIYGVLYFATRPMTIDEIKDEVAMSKGSVSMGVRELLETEMILKVWKKGERKDHFIAEKDFFKNFMTFIVKNIRQERHIMIKAIENTKPVLQDIAEKAEQEDVRDEATEDLTLIEESLVYYDWTQRLINDMESGDIFAYYPKDPKQGSAPETE
ncbi:GbsR/MarR family transcriptional regulator [Caldalkalibacillus salinus]|uniref:GbsR/MarR family transcriptional regulator n=1 Tax=Caldalkalibacillus salinus TaxID=2803787 RepID=UPI0019220D68|nr:transcriptional regulator [Caldalkalibacillus salinus]